MVATTVRLHYRVFADETGAGVRVPPVASPHFVVRRITPAEHLEFIRAQPWASFLQTPAWAKVKREWESESLGWFAPESSTEHPTKDTPAPKKAPGDTLVGAALVLYRHIPKSKRALAYIPEGPVLDWESEDLGAWLNPLATYLKEHKAFAVRIGPPVVTRTWTAQQIKDGIAADDIATLTDLPPAERSQSGARVVSQLHELGWRQLSASGGFAAGQPQYNFWIPLKDRTPEDVLRGMNQLWRRNIKKAEKSGAVVTRGGRADLGAFHDLYAHTAERDHFTPRPRSYFETMYDALSAEDPDRIRLYLAHHDGDLVASTIWIRVGQHAWYSYGASSSHKRDVRGSNAIQWQMIRDAIDAGADTYDLRGITDTLSADDPHVGLIQFKVGTGGEAVEYAGEWDLPLNPLLYKAFLAYLRRRG